MKLYKDKESGQTKIDTELYQASNGGIYLNFGNTPLLLRKKFAENVAYDVPDFSIKEYNIFYSDPSNS